jgi:hypothetical protein
LCALLDATYLPVNRRTRHTSIPPISSAQYGQV